MSRYRNLLYILVMGMASCSLKPEIYRSVCNKDITYRKVEMDKLLINIDMYDGKYVEIKGKYKSGFEESALYAKGFHINSENALWVEYDAFILKCPLVSTETKIDLFGKEESFKKMYNKTVILHGKIDAKQRGHLSQYKASIKDITLVIID
ncbi:hypothetical protein SRABI27_02313 [Pedobacter sp. Bi27]|uniref:hypothetical protein n=1 Tax=unclassified Pedobacter TaxID=2628915 RepID=UPI001D3447BE|nr:MULTISPECIES: hypothetical protein [unclassified Pedobacter]CAH0224522.1 hypothetical protein SRABI27_02313 [Pedobacter sp. Bi27]CAH0237681.1 hypothetical protein SRABI36_02885 [Pedobacter sp. Bi36]CAH0263957.1 hypothetical protein SRABI126_03285 [Pedobacter sp. Bi126]